MISVLLLLLGVECMFLLLTRMRERGSVYHYPFLASAVFAGWVFPQMVGLLTYPDLPAGALSKMTVVTILSVGMCYAGWVWRPRPMRVLNWEFREGPLLWAALGLTAFGAVFFFWLNRLPEEVVGRGAWTGIAVALAFFANVMRYGFALAALLYVNTRSRIALGIILFCSVLYLDRILIAGRRAAALEFTMVILLALWFGKRRVIPRTVMLVGVVAGTLLVHSMSEYRGLMRNSEGIRWREVADIPFWANLQDVVSGRSYEVINAVYSIEAVDRTGTFDFGLFHWNELVFNYVPAQLVGRGIKDALMVDIKDPAVAVFGHIPHFGSTPTGMTDAFQSFWYLGVFKFFLIALVLQRLYAAALRGNLTAQVLYMLLLVPGLQAITHNTNWFLTPLVHMAIFLLPALYLARQRAPQRAPSRLPVSRTPPARAVQA